ncbi:AI-2E family transporter [Hyphomonas sp. BRH_c22]|uniref:AI-2E family transporter n=1 Tax=Hyphomonas sp. BRH_c22 TaxID=1629710 RepID=UPI0026279A46|nr:AI-2E family transporter [Hyphomonas sp. BRH_c22]
MRSIALLHADPRGLGNLPYKTGGKWKSTRNLIGVLRVTTVTGPPLVSANEGRKIMVDMQDTSKPGGGSSVAAIVMATILVAVSLYLLRGIVAPFLMAVFLLIVIDGPSRLIRRTIPGMPHYLSVSISVAVILGFFAAIIWVTFTNIELLFSDAETYARRLGEVASAVQSAFGVTIPASLERLTSDVNIPGIVSFVAGWLRSAVSATGFALIYLGFMLASRRSFSRKLSALTDEQGEQKETEHVFDAIRDAVASYIWIQTATGVMIGVLSWLALWALGVPQPIFWAFLIFIASYVPIVGGTVGVFAPALFSLAESGGVTTPLLVLASLQTIQIVIGYAVQPRMQSRSLNIDPIVVLLALALWSMLLGPVGAFLSTPLTVTAMVVMGEFKRTRWIAIMLSDDGQPAQLASEVEEDAPIGG